MRNGDYRIDPKQTAVDFILAQIRSSNTNNNYMGKAIKAIRRLEKQGIFEQFGDEIVSLNEAFDWASTPEGYDFWKYIDDCSEVEKDVRAVSNE